METVQLVYEKPGRNVKEGELGQILRRVDEDVEPETICEWMCGNGEENIWITGKKYLTILI